MHSIYFDRNKQVLVSLLAENKQLVAWKQMMEQNQIRQIWESRIVEDLQVCVSIAAKFSVLSAGYARCKDLNLAILKAFTIINDPPHSVHSVKCRTET